MTINIPPQNWVPNGFPSIVKAFSNLSPSEQDSFQSFPEKQKNSVKEMMQSLAKHDNEAVETASLEEKQAALNADLKTEVEALVICNAKLKATNNKQEALQSLTNAFAANYLRNLTETHEGKSYYQKAEQQQQQKVKENSVLVHQTFENTAKQLVPNANPQECQAWIAAGDKAVLHDASQFAMQQAFQPSNSNNKGSARVAINNHIANAFVFNLLSSPEGRSFLQKAVQNTNNRQSPTSAISPNQLQ